MQPLLRTLLAAALAGALSPALAADVGPYASLTAGRTEYHADCFLFYSCSGGRATNVRVGGGYQFGVFALEGWLVDWGRAPLNDFFGNDQVRVQSLGISGAWRIHFGSAVQGILRTGVAEVRQRRPVESFTHARGTFGLGLLVDVAPTVALEIGYDLTTSGSTDRSRGVLAEAWTAGVRLRF